MYLRRHDRHLSSPEAGPSLNQITRFLSIRDLINFVDTLSRFVY